MCENEQAAKTTAVCDNERVAKTTTTCDNERVAKTTVTCDNERAAKTTANCEPLDSGRKPESAQQKSKPSPNARMSLDMELRQIKSLYQKMVVKYHQMAIERNEFQTLLERTHKENVQFKATVQHVTQEMARFTGTSVVGKRVTANKGKRENRDDTNAATLDECFTILMKELRDCKKLVEDASTERDRLDKQLTVERISFDDQLSAERIRFDGQLLAERDGFEIQLAAERSRINRQLVTVTDQLAAAEKLLDESKVREDDLRKIEKELTAERDEMTAERDKLTADLGQLKAELDRAKSKIQRQADELQTTIELMRAEAKADRTSVAESAANQRADIDRLTSLLATKSRVESCLRSKIAELEEMPMAKRSTLILPSSSSLMLTGDGQTLRRRERDDNNCNRTTADDVCNRTTADNNCCKRTAADDDFKRTVADNSCNRKITITNVDVSQSPSRVSSAGGTISSLPQHSSSTLSLTDSKMTVYVKRDVAEVIDKCCKCLAREPDESASALQRRVTFDVHSHPQTLSSHRLQSTDFSRLTSSKMPVLEEEHIVNHMIQVYQHGIGR